MGLLYLVGSVHWDLKGPERLRKFLDFVRPSYICLENSEENVKKVLSDRELIKAEIKKQKEFDQMMDKLYARGKQEKDGPNLDSTLKLLSTIGYETWVSYEHKKEDNPLVKIVPIDDHEQIIQGNSIYREALGSERIDQDNNFTPKFMNEIATVTADESEIQKRIERLYAESEDFYANNPEIRKMIPRIKKRDDIMESKLRGIVNQNPEGTIVFTCGNFHFFGNYENNLYERVQDLSPTRIKLPEVDKF